jgi:hypothetical protein
MSAHDALEPVGPCPECGGLDIWDCTCGDERPTMNADTSRESEEGCKHCGAPPQNARIPERCPCLSDPESEEMEGERQWTELDELRDKAHCFISAMRERGLPREVALRQLVEGFENALAMDAAPAPAAAPWQEGEPPREEGREPDAWLVERLKDGEWRRCGVDADEGAARYHARSERQLGTPARVVPLYRHDAINREEESDG